MLSAPTPTEPTATRSDTRRQCEVGAKLQGAREAAGLTREDLAHRMHLVVDHRIDRAEHIEPKCSKHEARMVVNVRQHERMSQRRFEELRAERLAQGWDRENPLETHWNIYFDAISFGPADATEEQLRAAVAKYEKARIAEVHRRRREREAEQSARIVAAVRSGDAKATASLVNNEHNIDILAAALRMLVDN